MRWLCKAGIAIACRYVGVRAVKCLLSSSGWLCSAGITPIYGYVCVRAEKGVLSSCGD